MLHKSDTPAMHKFHYTRKNKKVYQPTDARKATEKVVRAQASQEISYRALNNQQNGKNKNLKKK